MQWPGIEWSDIVWGDLATWASVFVTTAALAAAFYAGKKAADLLKVEQGRDRATQENETSRQASQVAAWAEPDPVAADGLGMVGMPLAIARVRAVAANGSDQPVYNVSVKCWLRDKPIGMIEGATVLPPGGRQSWLLNEADMKALVPPRDAVPLPTAQAEELSRVIAQRLRVEMYFTDARNRLWRRAASGALEMVAGDYDGVKAIRSLLDTPFQEGFDY